MRLLLPASVALAAACTTPAEAPVHRQRQAPPQQALASTLADLSTTETEVRSSDISHGDYFGYTVWGTGDIDADGYNDVAVGAMADDDGATWGGAVYVYLGSATGLDTSTEVDLTPSDVGTLDYVGWYRGGAGDFDGDGYRDVIFGSYGHDHSLGNEGAAWVFYGTVSGIDTSSEQELTQSSTAQHDAWGRGATGAGDVDGDGYDDVLVGCTGCDDLTSDGGAAFVYLGSSTGVDLSTETIFTENAGGRTGTYGSDPLGGADFNGDGYADIVVGVPTGYDGEAWLYLGSATGPDPTSGQEVYPSDDPIVGYAQDLAAADFDGDGQDDLVLGASGDDDAASNAGAVYVYLGSSSGVDLSSEAKWTTSDATSYDAVGTQLSAGSDLDGDGYPELLLGVAGDNHSGYSDAGAVYVYYGSATGLSTASEDKLTLASPDDEDRLGFSVAALGDIDGDGYGDIASGAPWQDRPPDGGSIVVWTGMCVDADADGVCVDEDCDDDDSTAGAASTWYDDADGDGYGDPASSTQDCSQPDDAVTDDTDCDDGDADVNPAAAEVCDGDDADEDCDGLADDADDDATATTTWYTDADGDGYGDNGTARAACEALGDEVELAGDCDDGDAEVWPGAPEVLDDGVDQDCDGQDSTADEEDEGKGSCSTAGSAPRSLALLALGLLGAAARRRRPRTRLRPPRP